MTKQKLLLIGTVVFVSWSFVVYSFFRVKTEDSVQKAVPGLALNGQLKESGIISYSAQNKGIEFKPNFNEFSDFFEDGETTWILTEGGLLRYEPSKGAVKFYGLLDGLVGEGNNIVKRGVDIWISSQRGITRLDTTTESIVSYVKAGSEHTTDSWADTFRTDDFVVKDGLASNSNLQLHLDPYTQDLWTVSFQGVSRFDDKKKNWVSYGRTIDGVPIRGSMSIAFTKDFVGIFNGSSGVTEGGVYVFDKTAQSWSYPTKEPAYDLDRGGALLVDSSDKFWVVARPKTYTSCGDAKSSKASRILGYSKEGWDTEEELNNAIRLGEGVYSIEFHDSFLWVYVTSACSDNGREALIQYDPQEGKVIKITSGVEVRSQWEKKEDNLKSFENKLIPEIEKIVGYPARKDVTLVDKETAVIDVAEEQRHPWDRRIRHLDSDLREVVSKKQVWEQVEQESVDLMKRYGSESSVLQLMPCNEPESSSVLYFKIVPEIGMGGPTETSEVVAVFDQEKRKFNRIEKLNYDGEADQISLEPFVCNKTQYLSFDTERGVLMEFPGEKQASVPIAKDTDFSGAIREFNLIREKKYFLSKEGRLGYFDVKASNYQYVDIAENQEVALRDLELLDVDQDDQLYVFRGSSLNQPSILPGNIFLYDAMQKSWKKVWIPKESRGLVQKAKIFGDEIWVVTNEGTYDNVISVMRRGEWRPERLPINHGEVGGVSSPVKFFEIDNRLLLSARSGWWYLR
jgi:hypothetical protein